LKLNIRPILLLKLIKWFFIQKICHQNLYIYIV